MYIVVQGQDIMLIALSHVSCKSLLFVLNSFDSRNIDVSLFSLVNKSCSKVAPRRRRSWAPRRSGSREEVGEARRKLYRSAWCSSGE